MVSTAAGLSGLPDLHDFSPIGDVLTGLDQDAVSGVWTPTEIESALDLAELKDAQYRGEAPASATNNIRQREDSLGLTALGKQRLGIKMQKPQPVGRMPALIIIVGVVLLARALAEIEGGHNLAALIAIAAAVSAAAAGLVLAVDGVALKQTVDTWMHAVPA